jgi:hypothetical protein
MGVSFVSDDKVPQGNDKSIWIIPEHADNRALFGKKNEIQEYLNKGGTILCLKQEQQSKWLPVNLPFWSAYQAGIHTYALMGWNGLNTDLFYANEAPIYAPSHPVFKGISSKSLHIWNKFDGRISDHVYTRPTNINAFEPGNWCPLAGGSRKDHISLAEINYGKGALLACQLNVLDNLDNCQTKTLFLNMLNYLSEYKPIKRPTQIALTGKQQSDQIEKLTGVKQQVFQGAAASNHDLLIATEGADIASVKKWANDGGKVLVLSAKLADEFDGFRTQNANIKRVAKMGDHPFLNGVCSANFTSVNNAEVKGYFSEIPVGANVELRGFATEENYGPVMATLNYGKGIILFSTFEIPDTASNRTRELFTLMLSNAGVEIPYHEKIVQEIAIKKTVPLNIDGNLNEWLEDMEDRWVTKYIHATPVYLTSESIVEGPPEFDLNLSAINYFMWDANALYIAGVVFSEERTWESGITWGSKKEYQMQIRLNTDTINIDFDDNKIDVQVNYSDPTGVSIKTGQMDSKELTDASNLQFNYIFKSGEIRSVDDLIGETFEMAIPWELLRSTASNNVWKALITIEAKGSKLQVPLSANPASNDNWLKMITTN